MSLDKSLKSSQGLARQRNVLTRAERLEKLKDDERWKEGDSIFGVPKVRVERVKRRKVKKKEEEAVDAAATPAADGKVVAKA